MLFLPPAGSRAKRAQGRQDAHRSVSNLLVLLPPPIRLLERRFRAGFGGAQDAIRQVREAVVPEMAHVFVREPALQELDTQQLTVDKDMRKLAIVDIPSILRQFDDFRARDPGAGRDRVRAGPR